MEYRSWISTLSGHLFFHLSEPWNYRLDRIVGDVIHLNEKIGDERYIIISLLADLRDYNTKDKVKYTRIFFFGQTHVNDCNDAKDLKGTISFFSNGKNNLASKSEKIIIENIQKFKNSFNGLSKYKNNNKVDIEVSKFNELEKAVLLFSDEQQSVYTRKIKFSLQSEGLIELGNADNAESTHIAEKASYRQAYYFIKFMFHNHMHHIKSAEDIIRLTKISTEQSSKEKFAYLMISDIKKYMVELRHSRKGFKELEGFSAYAKSLLRVLEKKKYISSDVVLREEKYFDNFVQSVNQYITIMKFNTVNTSFNSLLDTFLKIFVILMSLIAPYAIIKSKDLSESTVIDIWLSENIFPLYVYGFFILLLIIPITDLFYNRKYSFLHEKWNLCKQYFGKIVKKRHNPTLSGKSISKIIDIRQYFYHVEFKNKGWYFYLKVLFSSLLLVIFVKVKFF